jgi:hypothetical protein
MLNWVDGGTAVSYSRPNAAPAGTGHAALPAGLPSRPASTPMLAQPVIADSCPTVRAHLRQYAARGIKKAACETITLGAPPALARTGALAPARAGSRAAAPRAAGSSLCSSVDDVWVANRTEECIDNKMLNWEIIDPGSGALLGTAEFLITQDIILQTNSTLPVENDSINWAGATGDGLNAATITFTAGCSSPCHLASGGGVTYTASPGSTQGNIHTVYTDSPGTTVPDTFSTSNYFNPVWPGTTAIPAPPWSPTHKIRCDNMFAGTMGPGCVIPDYAPTVALPVSTYGAAAVNVLIGETYLPGTPGLTPSTPLTRGDPANTNANRAAICGSFKPLATVANDSCDEYPFASSQQSGGVLGLTGSNCLELLPFQVLGSWSYTFRNKYTFAPTQRCLRGHVDNDQNQAVGRAVNTMYTTNRMLTGDPYVVQVVS